MLPILKAAKIIVTDKTGDFDEFMRSLKAKILEDTEQWMQCTETRFIALESADQLDRLKSIIEANS